MFPWSTVLDVPWTPKDKSELKGGDKTPASVHLVSHRATQSVRKLKVFGPHEDSSLL